MGVNASQLERDLQSHGINLEKWGEVRETLLHLLVAELNEGDSTLEIGADGLVRVVHLIVMLIRPAIKPSVQKRPVPLSYLVERQRVYLDSRVVSGIRLPSGKIRKGEVPESALRRELAEEFGLSSGDYNFHFICVDDPIVASSAKYPGLPTCYYLHHYKVWIQTKAAARIGSHRTIQGHGVAITFGWDSSTKYRARLEREQKEKEAEASTPSA